MIKVKELTRWASLIEAINIIHDQSKVIKKKASYKPSAIFEYINNRAAVIEEKLKKNESNNRQ